MAKKDEKEPQPAEALHQGRNVAWARFLAPLVGEDGPVSVSRLDRALADLTGRAGDARGELYAYLHGQQRVGVSRAFWIGEALREIGVAWSSGTITLATSGHLAEFVALLALLTLRRAGEERAAAILAACAAVLTCDAPSDDALADAQLYVKASLSRANIGAFNELREAWEALERRRRGSYGRLLSSAPPEFRDAFASVGLADETIRARRVFEDMGRWALAVAGEGDRLRGVVEPLFAIRFRIDREQARALSARRPFRRDVRFDDLLGDEPHATTTKGRKR